MAMVHCLSGASYDVYVGRPHSRVPPETPGADGRWGNPFPLTARTTREAVVEKYRHWLLGTAAGHRTFDAARRDLRGKTLACWCAPNPCCHGEVLRQIAAAAADDVATITTAAAAAGAADVDSNTLETPEKFTALAARHPHALDGSVIFREFGRPRYVLRDGGASCVSVTEFVSELFPFDVEVAALRCAAQTRGHRSAQEFKDEWNEAALLGSELHDTIAHYYDSDGDLSYKHRGMLEVRHFLRFEKTVRHAHGWMPYRVEWRIVHAGLRLAGTLDALFQMPDGNFALVDWKRSKQIKLESWRAGETGTPGTPGENYKDCNASKFKVQLRLYAHILSSAYGLSVREALVVRLHPNAETYEILRVPLAEEFIAPLVAHRTAQLQ